MAPPYPLAPPAPVLIVMIDGLGDRAWPELDGLTPLEAASTPHLDALTQRGAAGLLHPLGPGRAPGTDLAHFVLLGYPLSAYPGRTVFEAAGCGFPLSPDDVVFRVLYCTARLLADGSLVLVDHIAGADDGIYRHLTARLDDMRHEHLVVSLSYTGKREGMLTVTGGASTDVTESDPFSTGEPIAAVLPLDSADDPVAARVTAEAVTRFLTHAYREFRAHGPTRDADSLFPLLKWVGRKRQLPSFRARTGMDGVIISSVTSLRGLAAELGMHARQVDAHPDVAEDMARRIRYGQESLSDGAAFVLLHIKAADDAGHLKDPIRKRDVIADLDRGLAPLVERAGIPSDTVICVTSDHGTPSGTGLIHSGDPVPIIIEGSGIRADRVRRFAERDCASGMLGHLRGEDFMPVLLNARGTTRYLGARLTPHVGLHWPSEYEPFRVE